jgi:hypothetical protein
MYNRPYKWKHEIGRFYFKEKINMPLLSDNKAIYTGQCTMGGLPADQAEHWNDKNYQLLGNFIYQMTVGKFSDRLKAQSEIYHLRRHFMKEEWDEYINKLEELRKKSGHILLCQYFNEITKETIQGYEESLCLPKDKESKETIVAQCKQVAVAPIKAAKAETVIQLSLF